MAQVPAVGRKVGHFHLLEEVGAGGMGVVYRAHDEHLDRDVAIKILPPGSLADENKRKRFKQEALALAKLNHPNIAAIYDFDSDGDTEFLVMELLSGKSLAAKLKTGPLSENQVIDFGVQMCEGLVAAHQQGVLHRDLKPANIGLSADGRLKILDFGLAKLLYSSPTDVTGSSTQAPVVGTLRYMAPEQLSGKNMDSRADIYAAGTVLYEMATGKRPFHEESGAALINSILNQLPIPPSKLNPSISSPLSAIILKALEKNRGRRYSSAQELMADLRQLMAGSRTAAVWQASRLRRRRLLLAGASLAVVVFAGVLGWRIFHRGHAGPLSGQRPMILVGDFENRTGEPLFDNSLHEMFTASLEQSHWVQVFPNIRLADVLRRMNRPPTQIIDESTGLEISQRENLQGVLLGSIVRLGKKYLVMARIEAPSGTALATAEGSAESPDAIPGRIDELAESLRGKVGESLQSVKENSVPLAKVSSSSVDAIRYYTLGKQNLYSGELNQAALMLSKAVQLDPNFAMAHHYLGLVYINLNDYGLASEQIRHAALLADRVSEPERLRILGAYSFTRLDYDKACQTYQLLMQLEPQDPVPYIDLGECESEQFNPAAAIAHTEKALEFVPQSGVRINLASQLLQQGNVARALEVAQLFRRDFADDMFAQTVLGRAYLAAGRIEDARQVFSGMIRAGGDSELEGRLYLADLAMAGGQNGEAEAELNAAIFAADKARNRVGAARARAALTEVLLAENASALSIRQLLAHVELPPDAPTLHFLLGKSHARAGQISLANKSLHAIDLAIKNDDVPALQALRYLLSAEISLAQKKSADAVKAAEKALQYQSSAFAIETLARCYAAAGLNTQAAQQYEAMLARTNELAFDYHIQTFDAPAFRRAVAAHYQLGVLYEKLGRVEDARAHLQKFLSYWSHADEKNGTYRDADKLLRRLSSAVTPTPAT